MDTGSEWSVDPIRCCASATAIPLPLRTSFSALCHQSRSRTSHILRSPSSQIRPASPTPFPSVCHALKMRHSPCSCSPYPAEKFIHHHLVGSWCHTRTRPRQYYHPTYQKEAKALQRRYLRIGSPRWCCHQARYTFSCSLPLLGYLPATGSGSGAATGSARAPMLRTRRRKVEAVMKMFFILKVFCVVCLVWFESSKLAAIFGRLSCRWE